MSDLIRGIFYRVRSYKRNFYRVRSYKRNFYRVRSYKKNFCRIRSDKCLIRSDKKMHPLTGY